jgi:hypothetical protein
LESSIFANIGKITSRLLRWSIGDESVSLLLYTSLSSFSGSLGLRTLSVHLLLDLAFTSLLRLSLVDVLNKRSLVLESVTLAQMVKLVVKVLINLSGSTVLDEQTTENAESSHPEDLAGHTSIGGTLPLTETHMTTFAAGVGESGGSGAGVHGHGFLDDEAVGDEFADSLAGVGVADFAHLVGVEPDLALTAAHDGRGETLLSLQINHCV